MKHIMVDLETLGNKPYSVVASIGAVSFDERGLIDTFYKRLNYQDQLDIGFKVQRSTINWWMKQDEKGRKEFDLTASSTVSALKEFEMFCQSADDYISLSPKDIYIWGNGATFDNILLSCLYYRYGLDVPWSFRNNRCFRTVKEQYKTVQKYMGEKPISHIALEDAERQAQWLIEICRTTGFKLQ